MALVYCKSLGLLGRHIDSLMFRCLCLVFVALIFRYFVISSVTGLVGYGEKPSHWIHRKSTSADDSLFGVRTDKFLEIPQIVWGLNNQKIAFARACLTARMLNRTLLMPSLSASLFYKETDLLKPISFDKIYKFDTFNSLCSGFVRLGGRFSDLSNQSVPFELRKGSGRKWTVERDLDQLEQFKKDQYNQFEVIRIVGKNPFLWHDHWPIKDYARVFECLVLVDDIAAEAAEVVSKIRDVGSSLIGKSDGAIKTYTPYVAVHMRIEKDWMIHCKKLEQRSNITQICSSKEEIIDTVSYINGLRKPVVLYLAVADSLLEDASILSGWKEGLYPFEKKKLGVWEIYNKYPYLIQSAIDYEVCLRADVFVGNSFSTFSSLLVLERTQKIIGMGVTEYCGTDMRWSSFAYNILGEFGGPQRWMTNMSDLSLHRISYGSNDISC
eukprot:TRINITY_DN7611_c0_g1_i1.p1 TRINITY_DN7611_c0_g1~~TRINITY_DN7611_c0_g1_i1.p1  ORF type:complete len:439 (-),score=59.36 TRINITY_DN7611_c0_g1_i1:713-2029(-)